MVTIQKVTDGLTDRAQVLFTMSAADGCGCLYLVGRLAELNENVYRMKCTNTGTWFLTLELDAGCEYHYCFRTDNGTWLHDPDMPKMPSPDGFKNSFVVR
jgi:hypothetical protein